MIGRSSKDLRTRKLASLNCLTCTKRCTSPGRRREGERNDDGYFDLLDVLHDVFGKWGSGI